MNLKDKVVIITGASSGIGKALALELHQKGALLSLAARSLDKLQLVREELENQPFIQAADVSREHDVKALIENTITQFGRIDVVISNAGISMRALFKDVDLNVLRELMDINFWGTVYCAKYALPQLLEHRGSFVGISSIAGYRGLPARTGYSASKFAMHGLLESLRTEHLHDGLHVLLACPGFTSSNIRTSARDAQGQTQGESPRNEGRMMSAEAVAQRIIKGIESRKRHLTMTRQGRLTVFLNRWFPSWMDRQVYNHMAKEADSPLAKPK